MEYRIVIIKNFRCAHKMKRDINLLLRTWSFLATVPGSARFGFSGDISEMHEAWESGRGEKLCS